MPMSLKRQRSSPRNSSPESKKTILTKKTVRLKRTVFFVLKLKHGEIRRTNVPFRRPRSRPHGLLGFLLCAADPAFDPDGDGRIRGLSGPLSKILHYRVSLLSRGSFLFGLRKESGALRRGSGLQPHPPKSNADSLMDLGLVSGDFFNRTLFPYLENRLVPVIPS